MIGCALLCAVLGMGQVDDSAAAPPNQTTSSSNENPNAVVSSSDNEGLFFRRLYRAYQDEFHMANEPAADEPPPPRRALPAPFNSPPLPTGEYQGSPLIGVPPSTSVYPLMKSIYGGPLGDDFKAHNIKIYGWANASVNVSNCRNSNTPDSYWIVPNQLELDQLILRAERELDSVQTDHIDWGFRSTVLYGMDYRYMTSGGWFSDQLLVHNNLYGVDPTEQYLDVYVPWVTEGMILRVGRWVATPDIETQFAPDNFMGSHSLLFTFDTYTQTGAMATFMLNDNWSLQTGIHAGTDMAPWYEGAVPTGMVGLRWVSSSNNDSIYAVLNSINDAHFQYFDVNGQPAGHDNFNYVVTTWQHKINEKWQTRTEGYYMWQYDAVVGGTPSIGPVRSYGGGGGLGAPLPGLSLTYGVLNYTMVQTSPKDFLTFRNEWWKDERGERSGFASTYSSTAIGWTHQFNNVFMVRPEIGYYRSWTVPAFDLGTKNDMVMCAVDATWRY